MSNDIFNTIYLDEVSLSTNTPIFCDNFIVEPNFKCEFKSEDGKDHWFYGFINDINQYFNPPLHTPMNQSNSFS